MVCLVITAITECYAEAQEELTSSRREGKEASADQRCSTIVDLELDINSASQICITRIRGETRMKREPVKMMALWALALTLALSTARNAQAQDAKNPYPSMAPIEKYLMDRDVEIALARSAAPPSIPRDATAVTLAKNGYETA